MIPSREQPIDLGVEDVSRGSRNVGMPKRIMPPGCVAGLVDLDVVAREPQVVGRGQSGRAGADDQHPLAGRSGGRRQLPALRDRLVAEEPLDRVDADRGVELGAVARRLARVVADPAHDRRERVVGDEPPPRRLVAAVLGRVQPALDLLAGRAGVVARREPVDVDRTLAAPGAGVVGQAGADVQRDRERLVHQLRLLGQQPVAGDVAVGDRLQARR